MASLSGKLEAEVEIKCDPDEFFHSFLGNVEALPNLCPDFVRSLDLHEGDWKTEGSVKLWTYTIDGKVEVLKEKLIVDEGNKTLAVIGLEGDLMNHCNYYKAGLQVTTRGQSRFAKWTIEYEKKTPDDPTPTKYLNWLISVGNALDASLQKA